MNDISRLDDLANAMMATRPELDPMSLDEWMIEHSEKLTTREKNAAFAILLLFEEAEKENAK